MFILYDAWKKYIVCGVLDKIMKGKRMGAMKAKTNCECCINYIYNEEFICHECQVNLDEDEMGKFLTHSFDDCPYFQFRDEYKTVRKQI